MYRSNYNSGTAGGSGSSGTAEYSPAKPSLAVKVSESHSHASGVRESDYVSGEADDVDGSVYTEDENSVISVYGVSSEDKSVGSGDEYEEVDDTGAGDGDGIVSVDSPSEDGDDGVTIVENTVEVGSDKSGNISDMISDDGSAESSVANSIDVSGVLYDTGGTDGSAGGHYDESVGVASDGEAGNYVCIIHTASYGNIGTAPYYGYTSAGGRTEDTAGMTGSEKVSYASGTGDVVDDGSVPDTGEVVGYYEVYTAYGGSGSTDENYGRGSADSHSMHYSGVDGVGSVGDEDDSAVESGLDGAYTDSDSSMWKKAPDTDSVEVSTGEPRLVTLSSGGRYY